MPEHESPDVLPAPVDPGPADSVSEIEEAVAELDAINTDGDAEVAHRMADGVLLGFVPSVVAEAWVRCSDRHDGFWYA